MDAANDGDLDALQTIYGGENKDPADKKDLLTYANQRATATALHLAANNGHVDCVQYIVGKMDEDFNLEKIKWVNK